MRGESSFSNQGRQSRPFAFEKPEWTGFTGLTGLKTGPEIIL
jgi:hypothetical protein